MLAFEWDEAKAASNLRKHGVSFETARLVFDDPLALFLIERSTDYQEERLSVTGVVGGVTLIVTHTERGDRIRLISARRATRHERRIYEEQQSFW